VKKATIEREKEGAVHVDGEPFVEGKIISIETLVQSLKIVVS
jgi:hypothetical protein